MLVDETPLDPQSLALHAQEAAAAFMAVGTAASTVRSYRSALAYWSAWLQLRYGQALGDVPLPAPVAIQFVLDHLERPLAAPVALRHRRRPDRRPGQGQTGATGVQHDQSPPGGTR